MFAFLTTDKDYLESIMSSRLETLKMMASGTQFIFSWRLRFPVETNVVSIKSYTELAEPDLSESGWQHQWYLFKYIMYTYGTKRSNKRQTYRTALYKGVRDSF